MSESEDRKEATGLFKKVLSGQIAPERVAVGGDKLAPALALLRSWQVERLTMTYEDFLNSQSYGAATEFFLDDIYGARDFRQRDTDAENVYRTMRKYFPEKLLVTMGQAIELNRLTQGLDERLLQALVEEVGMKDTLSAGQYSEAYRICDNYDERVNQIALIVEVGNGVSKLTRIPMIGMVLRAARRPARRNGWTDLQDFLERGFAAFKEMKSPQTFMNQLLVRENKILDNLFAGTADPFTLS